MTMPETLHAGDLTLRRATPDDVDDILEGVEASHADISPWMDWASAGYGRKEAWDWASMVWRNWPSQRALEFVIRRAPDDTFVGVMGLNRFEGRQMNLGFWMHSAHGGRGHCTRAARRLARAGFEELELDRIYLRHVIGHAACQRVAEKVGFQREGLLRRAIRHHGEATDMVQYSLIGVDEIREDER